MNSCAHCGLPTTYDVPDGGWGNTQHGQSLDRNGGICPKRNSRSGRCNHEGVKDGQRCKCGQVMGGAEGVWLWIAQGRPSAPIEEFSGEQAFLSNFAPAPITLGNEIYPSSEHLYQALKTMNEAWREKIRRTTTPGRAQRQGRKAPLRDDWDRIRHSVMLKCVRLKFAQNPKLRQKLLETQNTELIEGNYWHDNVWGNCTCPKCENVPGENLLGKILMQVRQEVKRESKTNH